MATVAEFMELHMCPIDLEEVAVAATKVEGDWKLSQAAESYLKYLQLFEQQLETMGFELG